jgi:hypothetical protein
MKTATFLLILFCFITVSLKSQYAPVTTAGIVTNATTAPGAVVVPITVKNFVSIGSFTLTLRYMTNQVTYVSAASHPSFPGMTVTNTVSGTLGKLVITWPQTPGGITLPDETHLLDLTFTYISGNSILNWLYSGGNICRYWKYSNGSYILLSDSPKASYYIAGGISSRGAPITYAPVINNPAPGNLTVPITVDNFTAVGAMSLTLEYNQAALTFLSCAPNPGLGGTFDAGSQMGPNGKMQVTIGWNYLAGRTLANGSTVVTINFNYSIANGSCSVLDWYETGITCDYSDIFSNHFFDYPTADYYHNGAVYTQYAPRVWLPVKTDAAPSGALSLPVFVNDFNNVRSFTLSFEYDGAVMTYGSFTPDAEFGGALTAADSPSGSKRKIVMAWAGTANKTLPEGSLLGTLNFTYNSGTSPLTWMVTDETSCRFNDASGNAYFDAPKSRYYQDGLAASHVAPQSSVGSRQLSVSGQTVMVPLNVYDFTDIGLFSFTLDYDPAVLTYVSASLVPAIGGTFTSSTAGLGRILMNWSGTAVSLADSSGLIDLTFTYNAGATTLEWYDDGNSCKYAESTAGPSLYDQPQSFYYINGYAGPTPLVADFIVGTPGRSYDTTLVLTDQTTGGPSSWNWSISPSTYYFANGTTSSSQNPQVKFTSNGAYTVILIVSRGTTSSIRIRTDYMYIGTPGLWTGITSGDWNVGSNWHNFKVPETSRGIVIPATAANWPHLAGDLTIGVLCEDITILDTAQLSVDGDLTIIPGSSLTFTGSGTLFLGGNWSDSGTFNAGTSTVDFTGPDDATIIGGESPVTFYKIAVSKTNTANLFIQGNVYVTGTE